MGALSDFWRQMEEMAEKARLAIPVWCVWETENPDAGYVLYRIATKEEAIAKYVEDMGLVPTETAFVSCRAATEEQVREQQETEAGWGSPPGPVSPRLKLEKI